MARNEGNLKKIMEWFITNQERGQGRGRSGVGGIGKTGSHRQVMLVQKGTIESVDQDNDENRDRVSGKRLSNSK